MPQQKDIRLEVKVRNNLILSAMERNGITSVAELVRQLGGTASNSLVGRLINMKEAARHENGEWLPVAQALADFFKCMPEDLFSEPQQYAKLEKNRTYAEITYAEVQQLTARHQEPVTPEIEIQAVQLKQVISKVLQSLTPREERVLRLRFGFETGEEETLEKIGEQFGLGPERIRQIEAKALRKLKHPSRSNLLKNAAGKDHSVLEYVVNGIERKVTLRILDDEVLSAL